ncbi:hypothetical protein IQ06DRAFT_43246 [Phaeosphaeriaceae sp. SRC1lsM3a]|nr:hypothetical protein IQ06DRAFT_43246 [Stagonospora sp. SRC1lsM3a]
MIFIYEFLANARRRFFPPITALNPWAFEKHPNPVIFAHLNPSFSKDVSSRFRHVPVPAASPGSEIISMANCRPMQPEIIQHNTRGPMNTIECQYQIEMQTHLNMDDSATPSKFKLSDLCSLVCSICGLKCATEGQINQHMNRKHIRRFTCNICSKAFSLNADLTRHKLNVHLERREFRHPTQSYKCSNPGCRTPSKVFLRKDNFERHVRKCR